MERGGEADAVHVPPPPEMVGRMLDALARFMDRCHPDMPVIAQCAVALYRFEAMRPFGGGNGRVGRMMVPLMPARSGRLGRPPL